MKYHVERFDDVYPEAHPLLLAHWQELNNDPGSELLSNEALYRQAEANNGLLILTARDEGKLVGYSAIFVHQGLHNAAQKQATQDVFYVVPEYRGGMTGTRLIHLAEETLRVESVELVYNHCNMKNPLLGRLLEALGYKPVSVIYQRRL